MNDFSPYRRPSGVHRAPVSTRADESLLMVDSLTTRRLDALGWPRGVCRVRASLPAPANLTGSSQIVATIRVGSKGAPQWNDAVTAGFVAAHGARLALDLTYCTPALARLVLEAGSRFRVGETPVHTLLDWATGPDPANDSLGDLAVLVEITARARAVKSSLRLFQVHCHLLRGLRPKQMAAVMGIAEPTARRHLKRLEELHGASCHDLLCATAQASGGRMAEWRHSGLRLVG